MLDIDCYDKEFQRSMSIPNYVKRACKDWDDELLVRDYINDLITDGMPYEEITAQNVMRDILTLTSGTGNPRALFEKASLYLDELKDNIEVTNQGFSVNAHTVNMLLKERAKVHHRINELNAEIRKTKQQLSKWKVKWVKLKRSIAETKKLGK